MLPATGGSHSIIRATSRNASAWRCPAHRRRVPSGPALGAAEASWPAPAAETGPRQRGGGPHPARTDAHTGPSAGRPGGRGRCGNPENGDEEADGRLPAEQGVHGQGPHRGEDACTGPQEGDSKKGGAPADQPVTIGDGKPPSGSGTDRYLISRSFSRTAYTTASIRECSWSFSRMFRM